MVKKILKCRTTHTSKNDSSLEAAIIFLEIIRRRTIVYLKSENNDNHTNHLQATGFQEFGEIYKKRKEFCVLVTKVIDFLSSSVKIREI